MEWHPKSLLSLRRSWKLSKCNGWRWQKIDVFSKIVCTVELWTVRWWIQGLEKGPGLKPEESLWFVSRWKRIPTCRQWPKTQSEVFCKAILRGVGWSSARYESILLGTYKARADLFFNFYFFNILVNRKSSTNLN